MLHYWLLAKLWTIVLLISDFSARTTYGNIINSEREHESKQWNLNIERRIISANLLVKNLLSRSKSFARHLRKKTIYYLQNKDKLLEKLFWK